MTTELLWPSPQASSRYFKTNKKEGINSNKGNKGMDPSSQN